MTGKKNDRGKRMAGEKEWKGKRMTGEKEETENDNNEHEHDNKFIGGDEKKSFIN